MISHRDSDYIKGRRGQPLSATRNYAVEKSCPKVVGPGKLHPQLCGEPMRYSVRRKIWYCPIHGDQK